MLTQIGDYQIEWHAERGARCRYQLVSEDTWSGWIEVGPHEQALVTLLASAQPLWYNQLTGTLSVGAGYAATTAEADAAPAPAGSQLGTTPNSGDDSEARHELEPPAADTPPAGAEAAPPPRWRPARSLLILLDQVNRQYPRRNKASDGTIGDTFHQNTNSDHNPHVLDAGIGVVTALDITHDPAHGCDMHLLAASIVGSQDARVKYVIWNRRIANFASIGGKPAWAWRPYTGANPHHHHLHISVRAAKSAYDSAQPWRLPLTA